MELISSSIDRKPRDHTIETTTPEPRSKRTSPRYAYPQESNAFILNATFNDEAGERLNPSPCRTYTSPRPAYHHEVIPSPMDIVLGYEAKEIVVSSS